MPMQEQFANAFGSGDFVAGALVRLNIGVVEEGFAVFDSRECIADVGFACANGFDLAAFQFDTRFVAVKNMVVAKRLAISDRFSCHNPNRSES